VLIIIPESPRKRRKSLRHPANAGLIFPAPVTTRLRERLVGGDIVEKLASCATAKISFPRA
jgi:hypothetical protein